MAIGGVVIQFKADADNARKDINKLTKTIDSVDSSSRRAGGGIAKMAKAGMLAVAAGAALGAAALYDFAKAAAADWQEAEKLARVLGAVPGITDAMVEANARWIDSMEIATGFSDTEFRAAIGRLAVATGDLGQAQNLAALAADVAAARNMNLVDVTSMLEKAVGGNTMMLKRNMPWLDLNKDGTITLAEAVKGLTEAYGGAAVAAADNNPWVRIQAVWAQMKESLGQFILPFLEQLGTWFADEKNRANMQEWITKVGDWSREIGEVMLGKLQDFIGWLQSPEGTTAIGNFTTELQGIASAFGTIAGSLDTLGEAWSKVSSFWQKIENMQNGRAPWDNGGAETGARAQNDRVIARRQIGSMDPAGDLGGGSRGSGGTVVNVTVGPGEYSTAQKIRVTKTRVYGGTAVA